MFDLISYFTKLLGGGLMSDLWGDLEPIKSLKIFEDIPIMRLKIIPKL